MDWRDLNRDGIIDASERCFADEILCSSAEEHEALFGDSGDFDTDSDDINYELDMAGLDRYDLEFMDEDEICELLKDANMDFDDLDF